MRGHKGKHPVFIHQEMLCKNHAKKVQRKKEQQGGCHCRTFFSDSKVCIATAWTDLIKRTMVRMSYQYTNVVPQIMRHVEGRLGS